MGLAKKGSLPAGTIDYRDVKDGSVATEAAPAQSGATAAIERLKKPSPKPLPKSDAHSGYKPRDFDAEARGKTRCVQFEAALMSPALAGLKFNTLEEFLVLVRQTADAGVKYTFGE